MTPRAPATLHFSHLHLENWRNFTRVDLQLEKRVFLVGPNASGKSNLLDAFRFLHDIVSVGGGFQEAVRRRGGVARLRCLAARGNPEIAIRVELGSGRPCEWEYELCFGQDSRKRPIIHGERVVRRGTTLVSRPLPEDESDPARLTQTYLEQLNVNQPFRAVADVFGSVSFRHLVPQLIREPDRYPGRNGDPYGGDFLEQLSDLPERTRTPLLRQLQAALRMAAPQLSGLELAMDDSGAPHLRAAYEHWRTPGLWQPETEFSDGTLRLVGLLWAVLDGTGTLLLEEPELSLHPGVVQFLPQMFSRIQRRSGRQIMLSTHSPELLRDDGIGLDEVFVLEPTADGTRVTPASGFDEVLPLLRGGVPLSDALIPRTHPKGASQLAFFGD